MITNVLPPFYGSQCMYASQLLPVHSKVFSSFTCAGFTVMALGPSGLCHSPLHFVHLITSNVIEYIHVSVQL